MPRKNRSQILGKRWRYEQVRRELELMALLRELRQLWRNRTADVPDQPDDD